LGTEEGRRRFEQEVHRFIKLYPGTITKPGEKFDFQKLYAKDALINNRDVSKYDTAVI